MDTEYKGVLNKWEPSASPGEELYSQKWLRGSNGGPEDFCKRFGLRQRHHVSQPLVLFKYQQLTAPFHQACTRECRGLVLEEGSWDVICYPYEKFFNVDEPNGRKAPPLDASSMRVYEKLDGSLATLYYYANEWRVASSGTPDGQGDLTGTETFAQLFWRVWKQEGYSFPKDKSCNYIFEVISTAHQIVVVPKHDEIILHGVRRLPSCEELEPEPVAAHNSWKCCKQLPLTSFDEIERACKQLNPHEFEGFVLCDKDFRRRKIKTPAYVGLSLLSTRAEADFNETNMLRIVRQNEDDEFVSYYPQWEVLLQYVHKRYVYAMRGLEKLYGDKGDAGNAAKAKFLVELQERGIDSSISLELQVREWFASLGLKQAAQLLDQFAPEDSWEKEDMLRRQKELFESLGLDTTRRGKKKSKAKKIDSEPVPKPVVKNAPSAPANSKWEVVSRSKKRNQRSGGKDAELAALDNLIADFKQQDLNGKSRTKGKGKGKNNKFN